MADIDLYENDFENFNESIIRKRLRRESRKMFGRRRPKRGRPRFRKRDKITIYDYIASSVPSEAHFLINKYGRYRRARDHKELAYQLKDFVRSFGENGLNELAKIHPDRKLLQLQCEGCKANEKLKAEEKYRLFNHQRMFNAEGTNYDSIANQGTPPVKHKEGMTIKGGQLVMAGFILMGVALIVKK